jgi:F0F1-type ATP synthase assembly protein I
MRKWLPDKVKAEPPPVFQGRAEVALLLPRVEAALVAIDLASAQRIGGRVVLGQAVTTAVVAALSLVLAGPIGLGSALLGGGINTLATLAMVLIAFGGRTRADAQSAVLTFFLGEFAKLAVMIVLFVVVLKVFEVAPLPLFGAFLGTFAVNWIVLARLARGRN